MDVKSAIADIIAIDIPKQVIIIGNIETTDKGKKIKNQCQYKAYNSVIPYALQALGHKAKIAIDNNTIFNIKPVEKGDWFSSQDRSCSVTGMIIHKIDGIKKEIVFKPDPKSKIYCKAYLRTDVQVKALKFLGKTCTFYLNTKANRICDRNKTIVDITDRTENFLSEYE